jgi:amidophosphoribosyltransferase
MLQESCGIVGVIAADGSHDVAQITFGGLAAVQHRGEDAAGIIVGSEDHTFIGSKNTGLVSEVFSEGATTLDAMSPNSSIAVGHVRWGTVATRQDPFDLVQPFRNGDVIVGHNGHIEGMHDVAASHNVDLADCGGDSDALARSIGHLSRKTGDVLAALHQLLPGLDGGYSLVVAEPGRLHGLRDPWGTRPLWMGRTPDDIHMFASEESALHPDTVESRELKPGEIVSVDSKGGMVSTQIDRAVTIGGMCAMEGVYFAREDGRLDGRYVYESRKQMGRTLAQEQPAEADVVIGVPNSGLAAAIGFAEEAGIPYDIGLFRNPYTTRTFIQASQEARRAMVELKLRANKHVLEGRRVVVVDDSIVRGTSTATLAEKLRRAGAAEVHMRVSSAPYKNPCYSGIATGDPNTLLARKVPDIEDMRRKLGVDSLGFLSTEGLARSLGKEVGSLCMACMTGDYPFPVPEATSASRQLKITPV